ncbi:CsbD family protein [Algoriphagus lutimaris]|uniref:CsbD family protein n=1 Tax=Algoriphagus lutimaris TaxID=613197 RepID=UPI00196A2A32|nr:CsbD family protein [Algoriphagus lutimaris]MBN3519098.1 CsbD family protein [Algoriphagus lutimaris]
MKILRSWREQKIMLKQRFSVLMDMDFDYAEGQREKMMERLSKILKIDREELDLLFEELQTY